MQVQRFKELHDSTKIWVDELGNLLIEVFHYIARYRCQHCLVGCVFLFAYGYSGPRYYGRYFAVVYLSGIGGHGGHLFQNQCDAGALFDLYCYYRTGPFGDC